MAFQERDASLLNAMYVISVLRIPGRTTNIAPWDLESQGRGQIAQV